MRVGGGGASAGDAAIGVTVDAAEGSIGDATGATATVGGDLQNLGCRSG